MRAAAIVSVVVGCATQQVPDEPAHDVTKEWPIHQKRSARVCVTLRDQGRAATGAAFVLDTSFYYAARAQLGPASRRTRHVTGARGRWCQDDFVYRHALIALEPKIERLDWLSVRWWWPNGFFRSVSFAIELDRFAIERVDNDDGVERFLLGAGPSAKGTKFTAALARLEDGKAPRGGYFIIDGADVFVGPPGGATHHEIDLDEVLSEQKWLREHLSPIAPKQRLALEMTGYAVPDEDTVEAIRDGRPDDDAGVFRTGEYGDETPFVPGRQIVFERKFIVTLP